MDLAVQKDTLLALLKIPDVRNIIGSDLEGELLMRLAVLTSQMEKRTKLLEAVVTQVNLDEVKNGLRSEGLQAEDKWLLKGDPQLVNAAKSMQRQKEEDDKHMEINPTNSKGR